MRRVVVTGMGIISCLGNTRESVLESLRLSKSGITFNEKFAEMGLRSQVCGSVVNIDLTEHIDRKVRRFMGDAAAYAYVAMQNAIEDAGM
ncbi:MAG: beta-ketoacyl-ACP synthase I, partial [Proteobacteria bacterium]|nr:beta-ketoacyl-ACP synthase I [Pseudomonadota bacterium]